MENTVTVPAETLYLKAKEVAQVLRLSKAMVYRLLRRSELPCTRFGKAIRVNRAAFEVWMVDHVGQTVGVIAPEEN